MAKALTRTARAGPSPSCGNNGALVPSRTRAAGKRTRRRGCACPGPNAPPTSVPGCWFVEPGPTGQVQAAGAGGLRCPERKRPLLVVDGLAAGNWRMAEAAPGEDGLPTTELADPGGLIGARLGVHLFRVDDLAERRFAIGEHWSVVGLLAEVVALRGIGLQIEELRRHADVVDELEFAVADHENAGGGPGGVILAEDGSFRDHAARHVNEPCPGQCGVV